MSPWPDGVVDSMNCNKDQNGFLLRAHVGAGLVSFLFGCFVVGVLTPVASNICVL